MTPPLPSRPRSPRRTPRPARRLLACTLAAGLLAALPAGQAQTPKPPVRVKFEDARAQVTQEAVLPVDPVPRIAFGTGFNNNMSWGLSYNGQRITYSPAGGHDMKARIDGREFIIGQPPGRWDPQRVELGKGAFGRKRHGIKSTWVQDKVRITQTLEIVPGKPSGKVAPGQKRQLDTLLVRYLVENKDTRPHKVALRFTIDMYVVNNDGALFASPTTHPGQILNGVAFDAKKMPAYIQVLQVPNLQNPGQVCHFTLKLGKRLEGPSRMILTNLGTCFGGWEVPAQPAGDSAVAIFFDDKEIPAGGKRDMGYAYGVNLASSPESEGRVSLALGGSFEPGKTFTVTAYVDEPVEGQSLALELRPGMELIGGKEVQPVPFPEAVGTSIVQWRARVQRLGQFPLRVRSSTGVTQTRTITISAP
jgi:hypothetical protein